METYQARCANCHGISGAGDGELVVNMPVPPQAFTDPAYRQTALPMIMYNQITNGDLNVGMPPFGPASTNPIDDDGRWDLVAVVYSLATPPEAIEQGRAVYETSCVACHGDEGRGDGPEAADFDPAPTDLTNLNYWFGRSNEMVQSTLPAGVVPEHTYELDDAELWAAVDYARTFTYDYANPAQPVLPIAAGSITGRVLNGTTGEPAENATVTLRAFTPDFNETLSLSTTTGIDGNYRFDVTNVGADWVFISGSRHNGLSFSSAADQLSQASPELDLPVTLFEQSTDASAVSLAQIHIVTDFIDDENLQISELYVVDNNQNAVFMGPTGDPLQGTVEFTLPAGAENLSFQRSFGSMDSFLPANEMTQTETGWADTLPLRAGPNALVMLVRYQVPYKDGMTLAHPVKYDTGSSTVILPNAGVEVVGEGWTAEEMPSATGDQSFLGFTRAGPTAGEALTIELDGRPRLVTGSSGGSTNSRDETTELLIGGAALLLAAGVGILLWRRWQQPESVTADAGPATSTELLQAIADLDDAYAAGNIDEAHYTHERAVLKSRLAATWQE